MTNNPFLILNGCATGGCLPLVRNKVVRIITSEYSENNAWNVNGGSGNMNNNNKNNGNAVRPVVELDRDRINGWMEAYTVCIGNKMGSEQCVLYRLGEEDLPKLMQECEERRYVPSMSVCFCVEIPKVREIFAAAFRDRIIQHWICLRIEPLFEKRFAEQGNVSWNCRKDCGTKRAAKALRKDIMEVSAGYTRRAWVGRFDIASFFMNIDICVLERLVVKFVCEEYQGEDKDLLIYLLVVTIRYRPQDNCERRGNLSLWEKLPNEKSLFHADRNRGLPIGNITSQLLANFYMSCLDGYMMGLCKQMGARYERFVDDFAVVCRHKGEVLMLRDRAKMFLRGKLNLTLHHDKQYIQDVTKGVYFVGYVIKMERTYIAKRTLHGLVSRLADIEAYLCKNSHFGLREAYELDGLLSSVNSYLGLMRGTASYGIRREAFSRICRKFFDVAYVKGKFEVARAKRKYSINHQLLISENYG